MDSMNVVAFERAVFAVTISQRTVSEVQWQAPQGNFR